MQSRESQPYIHGSKPKEQRRLSSLNGLLNQACLRELALTGGEAVLDIGSGLGQFTRDMARVVGPRGRVVGVERDIHAFEHLGCDPFVGRRLVSLLRDAGARPGRNQWIFFGSCAGAPEFPDLVRNAIGVIETAREVITQSLGVWFLVFCPLVPSVGRPNPAGEHSGR